MRKCALGWQMYEEKLHRILVIVARGSPEIPFLALRSLTRAPAVAPAVRKRGQHLWLCLDTSSPFGAAIVPCDDAAAAATAAADEDDDGDSAA